MPYETIEGDPSSGIVLLCDHARNTLPEEYGSLGLPAEEFERHIAYDIGVEALTHALAKRLGCPAVHSCFSRLLIDPNRGEDDPTIVMRLSDGTVVPGNHPITTEEIRGRIERFHAPYHRAIDDQLDACIEAGRNPLVLSIHSFTPVWRGAKRPWHGAILWDSDPRLNRFMIDGLRAHGNLIIGDNEPYDGALKNDTMYRHCTQRGLAHSLIEVRQDLIADEAGVQRWADIIAPLLELANMRPEMHEIVYYGSRTDGTLKKED
ncbi:N-formylglutamate amidohydrolase [Pseudahrensia aquimaris]|uniref:N-formylglutamate amidohydrolase n=1 Tax=Pseudahrensia aquimaris TaxID=744461 RepID=A0ABW3FDX2_9HYPH